MTLHPDILQKFIAYRIAPYPEAARALADQAKHEAQKRHQLSEIDTGNHTDHNAGYGVAVESIYNDLSAHQDYVPSAEDWHRLYATEMVAKDPSRYGIKSDLPSYGDDEKLYYRVYRKFERENERRTSGHLSKEGLYAETAKFINSAFKNETFRPQAKARIKGGVKEVSPATIKHVITTRGKARRLESQRQIRGDFSEFAAWAVLQGMPDGLPEKQQVGDWLALEHQRDLASAESAWGLYTAWAEAGSVERKKSVDALKAAFWKFQQEQSLVTSSGRLKGPSPLPSDLQRHLNFANAVEAVVHYRPKRP